jgi:hypothetical protein
LLTVDGESHFVEWPHSAIELFMSFDELRIGRHDASAIVIGDDDREIARGSLTISVRDPQVRPEHAAVGEGIRMLVSPARPTLTELWDRHATITIDSVPGSQADLLVRLTNTAGKELGQVQRKIILPIDDNGWAGLAEGIRTDRSFSNVYDEAQSCSVEVHRDGIGMASLTIERGFQALRWQFSKPDRDGLIVARLHDRTDGDDTRVAYFSVDAPLVGTNWDEGSSVALAPRGGLLRAIAGDLQLAVLAPTNPNAVLTLGKARPMVPVESRSTAGVLKYVEAHALWATAELPADPFAMHEQLEVLEAIARANASVLGGTYWATMERKLIHMADASDLLDEMQAAVGVLPPQKALAAEIGLHLYQWLEPAKLIRGFDSVIGATLTEHGVREHPSAARFLLTLAGQPGGVMSWPPADRDYLLARIVSNAVLMRAARFAVLGTRALSNPESSGGGF